MRNQWCSSFSRAGSRFAAQRGTEESSSGDEFVGVWSGTWEGAGGSGGFELTLEKGTDGVAGKVSVTGEPTYKATFKALSFDGKKMNAKYDFPPSAADAEIWLAATFDGNKRERYAGHCASRQTTRRSPRAHGRSQKIDGAPPLINCPKCAP